MMRQIRKEIVINAPIAKVWEHISTREKIARWFMSNDFEPEIGKAFSFQCEDQGTVSCVVKEIIPLQKLVYSFKSKVTKVETIVTFTLIEEAERTRLKLVHSGWETLPPDQQGIADIFDEGWDSRFLKNLVLQFSSTGS